MKVAFVKNGVVQKVLQVTAPSPGVDETAVLCGPLDNPSRNDLYDGIKFLVNPAAAELSAVEAKKRDISQRLSLAKTDAELRVAVASIDADINP